MAKVYYPAVLERGEDGGFGVFFPDLDGCVSAADAADEAARLAEEALALHLEGMAEAGEPIPSPSEVMAYSDPEVTVVAMLLVGAEEPKAGERVNVWLPKSLIAQIDAAAASAGKSRSAFIVSATRQQLVGRPSLTNMERIEKLVTEVPGLSKSEIAERLFGVRVQQRVNADVNWLVDQSRIVSDGGWPARFTVPGILYNPTTRRALNTVTGEVLGVVGRD